MASSFQTTQWSLILRIRSGDSQDSEVAMETLCRNYWLPLYSWLRAQGNSDVVAEDLTQGFFAHVIRRGIFERADEGRGKLRSYLLTCLKNYLADEKEKDRAQKRAGKDREVPLSFVDSEHGERQIERDLRSNEATPAEIYEYRWARTMLQIALTRLEMEYQDRAKGELYRLLSPILIGTGGENPYARIARQMTSSEGAVRVAYHRFKERFREVVREEVARTLLPDETIEDEMIHLAQVLDRNGKKG